MIIILDWCEYESDLFLISFFRVYLINHGYSADSMFSDNLDGKKIVYWRFVFEIGKFWAQVRFDFFSSKRNEKQRIKEKMMKNCTRCMKEEKKSKAPKSQISYYFCSAIFIEQSIDSVLLLNSQNRIFSMDDPIEFLILLNDIRIDYFY